MKKFIFVLLLVFLPLSAQSRDLKDSVVEFKLSNGMKWLLVKRGDAPVFSGNIIVRVGGVDETKGKSGLAHMFEHMAFKGSAKVGTKNFAKEKVFLDEIEKTGEILAKEKLKPNPDKELIKELSAKMAKLDKEAAAFRVKNEVWEVLSRNGAADLNAYTSKDITSYHASMPINRLNLWAKTLAEMIFEPVFREFYTERSVIAEERRSGTENNPDGATTEKLLLTSFKDGPYHSSVIGFEKDILGLTIADARAFHDKFYVASNMVGSLVGDLNIEETKRILEDTFGKYPKRPVPNSPETQNVSNGGVEEKFKFDAEPTVVIIYHKPTLPDPTEYAFDVINTLLCEGMSSRLQKKLVYEKHMAQSVYCSDSFPGSRVDNLFLIWIDPLKSNSPKKILDEVSVELEKLKTEYVSQAELDRSLKNITANRIFGLESNMGFASSLAEFEVLFRDWRLLIDYPKHVALVDKEKVMEVAKKYLNDDNRVVIVRQRGKTK